MNMLSQSPWLLGLILSISLIATAAIAGLAGMGTGNGSGWTPTDAPQRADQKQKRHAERMRQLEQRLQLTSAQQGAWDAFIGAQRYDRSARTRGSKPLPLDSTAAFFDQQIDYLEWRLAGLRSVAQAADDLYRQLAPDQRTVMDDFFAEWADRSRQRSRGSRADAN